MIEDCGFIDIARLEQVVTIIPWQERVKGSAHGCPSFRSTDLEWSIVKPVVDAYIERILEYVFKDKGGEVGETVFSKVFRQRLILPHVDGRVEDYSRLVRVHLPVFTNSYTFMIYPGTDPVQAYNLKPGHIYTVDVLQGHMVVNAGQTDRVHLYFDYFKPKGDL